MFLRKPHLKMLYMLVVALNSETCSDPKLHYFFKILLSLYWCNFPNLLSRTLLLNYLLLCYIMPVKARILLLNWTLVNIWHSQSGTQQLSTGEWELCKPGDFSNTTAPYIQFNYSNWYSVVWTVAESENTLETKTLLRQ